jgi:uncharacterized membrane protein YkvA (DUF1232 family)
MVNLPIIGEIKLGGLTNIIIACVALLYIISPIDLIPDFIPIIGWIDDLIVAFIGFKAVFSGKK